MKINYSTDLSVSMSQRELELIKDALLDAYLRHEQRADDTQDRFPELKALRYEKAETYKQLFEDANMILQSMPF